MNKVICVEEEGESRRHHLPLNDRSKVLHGQGRATGSALPCPIHSHGHLAKRERHAALSTALTPPLFGTKASSQLFSFANGDETRRLYPLDKFSRPPHPPRLSLSEDRM